MRQRKDTGSVIIDPSQLQLYDVPAVAKLLSVGPSTVYGLIKSRELKAMKIGHATRISAAAVKSFIDEKTKQAS